MLLIQTVSSMAHAETAGREILVTPSLATTTLLTSLVGRSDRQHLEVEIKTPVTVRASTTLDFRCLGVLGPKRSGRSCEDGIIRTHVRRHDEGYPGYTAGWGSVRFNDMYVGDENLEVEEGRRGTDARCGDDENCFVCGGMDPKPRVSPSHASYRPRVGL